MADPIQLEPLPSSSRLHTPPTLAPLGLHGEYSPSKDGTDTNLLVMLHGLGDTARPFADLGRSLNLPQTAVLSLRGLSQVPLLEEEAFQWWQSFDQLGELVRNPNPTATLDALYKLLVHLTTREGDGPAWLASDIHFFGFGQGGSVAAELGLHWSTGANKNPPLGSITSISAPLVSHPTLSKKCATPALLVLRRGEERSVGAGSYRKGYENVQEVGLGVARSGGQEMLRGRDEWEPVMRFWATRLRQRSALEFGEDVYVVKSALDAQGRPIGGR